MSLTLYLLFRFPLFLASLNKQIHVKKEMHWAGIEPGPPAWQARILPLNHQCHIERLILMVAFLLNLSLQWQKKSGKWWTNNLGVRAPSPWSGSLGHYNMHLSCFVSRDGAAYRNFTLWLFSSNRILRSPSDQVKTWPFPCHLSLLYVWCTTAYLSDVSSTILEFSFNKDPQTLSSWLESNHLTVNSTKTLELSVGPCDYDYSLFLMMLE